MTVPHLFEIAQIGSSDLGYISVAEFPMSIPFEVKRIYWTYYTPNNILRGQHAHLNLQQVILAVSGTIRFKLENTQGEHFDFNLDTPNSALYIPPGYWREIKFSHNSVLLCLASEVYDETDYVRNYDEFKRLATNV
jgi:dTDP-4-dehydrorhamnose 3,5-epimerase-like enzyme